MKAHLKLTLVPGAPVDGPIPHWERLAEDKSLAPERFHRPVDELLRAYGVPVWVTHEYRPAAERFSPEEIASGLDRIYRLILQRDGTFPADLIDAIRLLPTVAYAHVGRIGQVDLPPVRAHEMSVTTDMGSRRAIGLPEAHSFTRGSRDVTVAVLDTGVSLDHPELQDALLPGRDFVDIIDGAKRFLGDFLEADDVPDDDVGHGTHVAGIIAGAGRQMPAGVVPSCRILPVRVLGALQRGDRPVGAGLVDNINAGIKWAVDQRADVISMSLGVEPVGHELPHQEVVDYARRKGVTVVAASGNDGSNTTRYFPGALAYVIAVGASDPEGEVASFSTYGSQVDFVAPGTDIYSCLPNRSYGFSTGTSHATPFVSGGAAMLCSLARSRGARTNDSRVKWLLRNTADRVDTRFRTDKAGFGRLNLLDAVRLLDHKLD
jgi:subtilisin family serine protease